MRLALVWAQTPAGVIGRDGALPWHLPEDLARFRRLTAGHAVLMGRRTWESLPDRMRPLPDRRNVVLSRDPAYAAAGAQVVRSLPDALALVGDDDEVWVIGGATLFDELISRADRLEVTEVDLEVPGDTHAPAVAADRWRAVAADDLPVDGVAAGSPGALDTSGAGQPAGSDAPADDGWLRSRSGTRYRFRSYVRSSVGADDPGPEGAGAVA